MLKTAPPGAVFIYPIALAKISVFTTRIWYSLLAEMTFAHAVVEKNLSNAA
jgi:hypothetical protein